MMQYAAWSRPLLLAGAMLISAGVSAQVTTPVPPQSAQRSAPPIAVRAPAPVSSVPADSARTTGDAKPAEVNSGVFFQAGPGLVPGGSSNTIVQRSQEYQQRLRAQLADPKQREQLIAERLQLQRFSNPELARVLRLDAAGEQKLLALLVDQQLSDELRERPFGLLGSRTALLEQEAALYDEHLREITRIIGMALLDTYVDYERTRAARMRVQGFDAALPAGLKLSNEQKDALVPLIHEHEQQRFARPGLGSTVSRLLMSLEPLSAEAQNRRSQLLRFAMNQQLIRSMETANSLLAERLPQVLTPEQAQRYLDQESQPLENMRAQTEELRREAAVGLEEQLDTLEDTQAPALSRNAQLQVTMRINGTAVTRTVTSVRGAPVTIEGVQGLSIEAVLSQPVPDQTMIVLKFYESVRGGRRLVGQTFNPAYSGDGKPPVVSLGISTSGEVLRGRKAYLVQSSVKLTYL